MKAIATVGYPATAATAIDIVIVVNLATWSINAAATSATTTTATAVTAATGAGVSSSLFDSIYRFPITHKGCFGPLLVDTEGANVRLCESDEM